MKKRKRRNAHFGKNMQHRLSILLVSCVVVILTFMVFVASLSMHKKNQVYKAQEHELEEQLKEEKARAEEIEEMEDYVGTDKYVQDVAKDKLGLAFPNEILFVPE